MAARRKRLIEVAFPLEEVSEHSRREKYVRHGHISTLHIWWARRPLAACRAFIYASLVDDPDSDAEREALLKEVADLASWDAVRHPERVVRAEKDGGSGLTGTQLVERARQRILDCNDGKPPKLLDPFAGGGAIPLEALRLGCEVEASDLNPVAVLILKATVEYPQKYGHPNSRPVPEYIRDAGRQSAQSRFIGSDPEEAYRRNPLATDVRYWGNWMLEKAREELKAFYPPDPDGTVPVAYLWSRTILCPSCNAEMPLIRQYWLARKDKKRVALRPVVDRENERVDFQVMEGQDLVGDPADATTTRGDTKCLLCGQVTSAAAIRDRAQSTGFGEMLTAVVKTMPGHQGKHYRRSNQEDQQHVSAAKEALTNRSNAIFGDYSTVPDEPIDPATLGLRIDALGFRTWGQLFNQRQALAISTFASLVESVLDRLLDGGVSREYAHVVTTCLALVVDRLAVRNSNQCIYNAARETIENEIARGALPPVWDYAEAAPTFEATGSWRSCLDGFIDVIEGCVVSEYVPSVRQRDITLPDDSDQLNKIVITDPPYYNAVDYAGLSDFFYVWLKRALRSTGCHKFDFPLTPKTTQAIMNSESKSSEARDRYVTLMKSALLNIHAVHPVQQPTGVVFASTSPDAWATLIENLLDVGLVPLSSWPIDTEMQSGMVKIGQARLSTSVWMACRKREEESGAAFLGDVVEEMRPVIRERLLYFWSKGIRGADFFISAIGPALSVFGRYQRVMRPDGSVVTVREFLDIVRRESTTVALEQVLQGADLGVMDPVTRQYVTWAWSYSKAPLDAGDAIALCLATGADYGDTTRPHSITAEKREKSKKVVQLRSIRQRAMEDDDMAHGTSARPAPLIDQLQYSAWLWGQNRASDLGEYMGRLGESRWNALRTLGQAVAECLPEGDEDRRIILGLLGSNVTAADTGGRPGPQMASAQLPGFDDEGE